MNDMTCPMCKIWQESLVMVAHNDDLEFEKYPETYWWCRECLAKDTDFHRVM